VSASGLVTTLTAGTANITATSETRSGSAVLTVNAVPIPVATVTVSLAPTSVTVGATSQATAVTLSGSGTVLTGRTITWTSANPAVATVNINSGLVTAVTAGTAIITATSETKTGTAIVTVTP